MQVMEAVEAEAPLAPHIVRRVCGGRIETLERRVDGRRALCVFWSEDHARREMDAAGWLPEDGWQPLLRDHEEMALVFEVLPNIELVCLEPCPEDEQLWGVFELENFIVLLEESLDWEEGLEE